MSDLNLVKARSQSAEKISKNVDLEKESKALLQPGQSLSEFIQCLLREYAYKDVIGVIAQALPQREGVYWASLCTRDTLDKKGDPENIRAIKTAEQWLIQPNEDNRYMNQQIAEKLEHATAPAWVANAAFWSGGSITNRNEPKVEPPDGLCGKAVCGAVLLASADVDLTKTHELQKRFIKRGIHIAQGGKGDNI